MPSPESLQRIEVGGMSDRSASAPASTPSRLSQDRWGSLRILPFPGPYRVIVIFAALHQRPARNHAIARHLKRSLSERATNVAPVVKQ